MSNYNTSARGETKRIDTWSDNQEEQLLNEKSAYVNKLKIFTPVNTLLNKQEQLSNSNGHQIVNNPTVVTTTPALAGSPGIVGPGPSAFSKLNSNILDNSNHKPINLIPLTRTDSEQLQLQGPQTPHMLNSGIIRGSTIMVQINEAATVYLKDIEAKNQNKFLSQKEDLEIFKYLSLTYNVNTIVDSNFASASKHNQLPSEVLKVCVDSVKINNRAIQRPMTLQTIGIQQSKPKEQTVDKAYKNVLTSLFFENKPEQQLLMVEFVNLEKKNNNNISSQQMKMSHSQYQRSQQDNLDFLQGYKAFPVLYHLKFDEKREICPFIAFDKFFGRHFIYNNDDKIMVFSHEPIQDSTNDKSKPLLSMYLNDKQEDYINGLGGKQKYSQGQFENNGDVSQPISYSQQMQYYQRNTQDSTHSNVSDCKTADISNIRTARINPTLQIINDSKGNSALLVIGGYIEHPNGTQIAVRNIKVFKIGKRKIDIKPAFKISLKHPRVNPIVMRVKQSDCKDIKTNNISTNNNNSSYYDDKKYLILLGGALPSVVEDKKLFVNTNTQCSVIEYEAIFNQLMRKDTNELAEQKTLKVLYNDKENGRNYEKLAVQLSKGVFLHQKNEKSSGDIHNKMFIICDKKKSLFQVHAISLSENFISIFDSDSELKAEHSWSSTNMCSIDNYIVYISPQQAIPMVIETSSKNSKSMPSEALIELNSFKNNKDIKEINPKKPQKTCACEIF